MIAHEPMTRTAFDFVPLEALQALVRPLERYRGYAWPDRDRGRLAQQVLANTLPFSSTSPLEGTLWPLLTSDEPSCFSTQSSA